MKTGFPRPGAGGGCIGEKEGIPSRINNKKKGRKRG